MRKVLVLLSILSIYTINAQQFQKIKNGALLKVSATPSKGFNYDYLLFIPEGTQKEKKHFLLVEPNNTGFPDDNIMIHEERARFLAISSSIGNYVSTKLKMPLLIPIFPRPAKEPLVYTHALDRDAILIKERLYSRLDLQLVKIIENAKIVLEKHGYTTQKKNFMNGFSASGSFMNRFAYLHPEIIQAIATGGINGILMLPVKNLEGEKLEYPLGLSDFENIVGYQFDLEVYKSIPQFIYMGKEDTNDAVKFNDGYSDEERRIIHKVLSKVMLPDRWAKCQEIYTQLGINAKFKTYENIGHGTPFSVLDEITQFFDLEEKKELKIKN